MYGDHRPVDKHSLVRGEFTSAVRFCPVHTDRAGAMQAAHKFQEMAHLGRIVRTATDPLIRQDNAGRAQYTFPPSDRTGVCRKLSGMGNGTSRIPAVHCSGSSLPYCDAATAVSANTTKERFYA